VLLLLLTCHMLLLLPPLLLLLLLLLQLWLPELGFRLRRLRMMYPDFVTE
jgi:hypothetical protein